MQLYSHSFQFSNTCKDILILCDQVVYLCFFHLHYWGRGFCCLLDVVLYEAHVFGCLTALKCSVPLAFDYIHNFYDAFFVSAYREGETA